MAFQCASRAARHPWRARRSTPPRHPRDDGSVIATIEGYAQENPRHGLDKLYPVKRNHSDGGPRRINAAAVRGNRADMIISIKRLPCKKH